MSSRAERRRLRRVRRRSTTEPPSPGSWAGPSTRPGGALGGTERLRPGSCWRPASPMHWRGSIQVRRRVPQDQRGLAFGGLARTTQAALHRPRSTSIALVLAGPRGPLLRGAGRHGASSTASTIARSGSPAPRAAWRRRRSRHRCPAEAMENASRKLTRSPEDAKLVPRAVIACWWIGGIKLAPACYQSATILSRSKPIRRDLDRQEAAPKCFV